MWEGYKRFANLQGQVSRAKEPPPVRYLSVWSISPSTPPRAEQPDNDARSKQRRAEQPAMATLSPFALADPEKPEARVWYNAVPVPRSAEVSLVADALADLACRTGRVDCTPLIDSEPAISNLGAIDHAGRLIPRFASRSDSVPALRLPRVPPQHARRALGAMPTARRGRRDTVPLGRRRPRRVLLVPGRRGRATGRPRVQGLHAQLARHARLGLGLGEGGGLV